MGKTYRKAIVYVQDGVATRGNTVICAGNGLTAWGKAKRKAERKRARQEAKAEASYDHMMMLADERQAIIEANHAAVDADLYGDIDNGETWYDDHDYYDPRDHDDYADDEPGGPWAYLDDPYCSEDYGYADAYYSRAGFTRLDTTPAPYGDDSGESLGAILARALRSTRENHL